MQQDAKGYHPMLESGKAPKNVYLLLAAESGDFERVVELLAAGADPLVKNQQGKNALQLADRIAIRTRRVLAAAIREAAAQAAAAAAADC
ncbi:hypothetical protein D9Q98_000007 [Chlorella vulgaris]|uniref:Ankyrin repeat domain-containing protein n=1 Tax=Chlorella vulgaris TaxID=3077 RepID=A0A9D4TX94_CHLVU|nr:hypothetical protein D9Q98_000007 [Chlorella vulgaris]